MSGYAGHYSLIQYCPDPSRAEVANVGVLLSCPALGFLDARTAAGNDRVRRFFKGQPFDRDRINAVKRSIGHRLRVDAQRLSSISELQGFIESRANDIVLTPLRAVKVTNPEADLNELFAELVGGRVRSRAAESVFTSELAERFAPLVSSGLVEPDASVRVPLLGKTLKAAYAYRNGALNLVKPQVFPANPDEARKKAGHLALEGDLLQRHPDQTGGQYRLVVVSAGQRDEASSHEERVVMPLFAAYDVRFVRRHELSAFVEQVRQEAHR